MMMMGSRGSGGGCCVARSYDAAAAKMDRIMLKFRPIAPKPILASSGGSSPDNKSSGAGGDTYVKIGRGKRRYQNSKNKVQRNNVKRRRTTSSTKVVTTLPLLPQSPEKGLNRSGLNKLNEPIWLNFNSGAAEKDDDNNLSNVTSFTGNNNISRQICYGLDQTVTMATRVVGGTCVTLECLTYTMVDVDGLGRTDEERVMNLEWDTCPGFVSDRLSRVSWSNAAFNKLVAEGDNNNNGRARSMAWVAMKESVPVGARAFSCRVRVQTGANGVEGNKKKSMTVPCDVWRMDCGGFAWRLDVKAALSLGL